MSVKGNGLALFQRRIWRCRRPFLRLRRPGETLSTSVFIPAVWALSEPLARLPAALWTHVNCRGFFAIFPNAVDSPKIIQYCTDCRRVARTITRFAWKLAFKDWHIFVSSQNSGLEQGRLDKMPETKRNDPWTTERIKMRQLTARIPTVMPPRSAAAV